MRNFVLIICTLSLVLVAQVSAQSIVTSQQVTPAQVTPAQSFATPIAQQAQQAVQYPQTQGVYEPVGTTTSQPAVYDAPVYQNEQYYYQPRQQVRAFRPVRQANYNSVPITQRPNRPGHFYGNTVRFLYRLGR